MAFLNKGIFPMDKGKNDMRDSNYELLRILCIIGIVTMHTFGLFYGQCTDINLIYGVFINSLFNACVTLFILISGFFGIRGTLRKVIQMEITVLTYSILSFIVNLILSPEYWDIKEVLKEAIKSCFPISSNRYWFMTAYMLLLIFSNYINSSVEKLEKQHFQRLILAMLFLFSILPSIIQIHIMNDGGKGFLNMLLIYLIGRYLGMYRKKYQTIQLGVMCSGVLLIEFLLNYSLTILRGGVGIYAPFARDCSIFIIAFAVVMFLLFGNIKMKSVIVNRIARHVVAVYLFEGAVRKILSRIIDLSQYGEKWYLFAIINLYVLVVVICCIAIDICKGIIFDKAEQKIEIKLSEWGIFTEKKVTTWVNRIGL